MSTYREDMPHEAVYTGLDELAVRGHVMNAVGDEERGPRLIVDAPGLAVVLTADEADELARRLMLDAERARLVFDNAHLVALLRRRP